MLRVDFYKLIYRGGGGGGESDLVLGDEKKLFLKISPEQTINLVK